MESRKDRTTAIGAARRLLERQPVILGTKTTGLGDEAEICEIAIIDHTGRALLDTRVRPVYGIPWQATHIHGIEDSDVANAPDLAAVLDTGARRVLQLATIGIYEANDNLRLIRQSGAALARYDIVSLGMQAQAVCIMEMYAHFYDDWAEWHGSYTWQSLETAAAQCGLEWDGKTHSALADARMTLQVLRHMAGG